MPLNNVKVKNADRGSHSDGRGLILIKNDKASGRWVYRYQMHGRRRDMGLGRWPAISLAEARKQRDRWAKERELGNDPVDVRDAERVAAEAERARHDPTFAELVDMVFTARAATLRGGGERGRWLSPLRLYALPAFGSKLGSKLHQRDIVDALRPIWRDKHPTAVKVINRVGIVLKSSKRMGFPVEPQIVEAAREMLGAVKHVEAHTAALPWQEVPTVYAALPDTMPGLCNRWLILTGVRMNAARHARIAEIEGYVWTIPADRIKGQEGKVSDFRVPLSAPALQMVEEARAVGHDLLFPGLRGGAITDAAVAKCLSTMEAGCTPHGWRTSFRTWAQDTGVAYDVAETVLGHKVLTTVEGRYARSDLLDRRRPVMEAWARYVTGQTSADVVPLRG